MILTRLFLQFHILVQPDRPDNRFNPISTSRNYHIGADSEYNDSFQAGGTCLLAQARRTIPHLGLERVRLIGFYGRGSQSMEFFGFRFNQV
jgi:hypothetical protein